MIDRAEKMVSNVSRSESSESETSFRSRLRKFWLVLKHAWFVPFIWWLAWCSYWIVADVIVWSKPIVPGNPWNYFGVIVSSIALLIKGRHHGSVLKKPTFESIRALTQIGGRIKSAQLKWPKSQGEQAELLRQRGQSSRFLSSSLKTKRRRMSRAKTFQFETPKPRVEKKAPVERVQVETPRVAAKLEQSSVELELPQEKVDQKPELQESATDCLTCPRLVSCEYRRNAALDSNGRARKGLPCRTANS
jgi:hypothetical protein